MSSSSNSSPFILHEGYRVYVRPQTPANAKPQKPKPVVNLATILVRVSTKKQASSLHTQECLCRWWTNAHGYTVEDVVSVQESAYSHYPWENRLEDGKTYVVYSVDRFSRRINTFYKDLAKLVERGITLVIVNARPVENTPDEEGKVEFGKIPESPNITVCIKTLEDIEKNRAILDIAIKAAYEESARISRRVSSKRILYQQISKETGLNVVSEKCNPPYGYTVVPFQYKGGSYHCLEVQIYENAVKELVCALRANNSLERSYKARNALARIVKKPVALDDFYGGENVTFEVYLLNVLSKNGILNRNGEPWTWKQCLAVSKEWRDYKEIDYPASTLPAPKRPREPDSEDEEKGNGGGSPCVDDSDEEEDWTLLKPKRSRPEEPVPTVAPSAPAPEMSALMAFFGSLTVEQKEALKKAL